ncbi:MAG: C39 family peptidase [Oscillospiraceae bacterium]
MEKKKHTGRRYNLIIFIILLLFLAATAVVMSAKGLSLAGLKSPEGYEHSFSSGAAYPDLSQYPEALAALYEKNEEARQFVLDYFEKSGNTYDIDLSEYRDCETVPLLMQWDERWGYTEYSGNLFGLSGCGPTCLSMAAIYLTGDTSISPRYVADYSTQNGYSTNGNGTKWTLFSEGCSGLGISSQELPLSQKIIDSHLESGEIVALIMGPGDFTDSGHFILLTAVGDGGYTVNDPNSRKNSDRLWSYDEISDQIKNIWALSAG